MLCQGLGLLNQRSVCVLTDIGREALDPEGRRYLTADARTRDALAKVVDKIRGLNKWIGVIDGGANRSDMDRHLYSLAHLVLLPFRDSHEDMRTVQQDLEAFPRALALPMQWPTNPWAREAADRSVEAQLGAYRNRILEPVFAISSSKVLLQKRIPDSLPSPLANACRRVAAPVLDILRIEHESVDIDAEDTMEERLPPQSRNAVDSAISTH